METSAILIFSVKFNFVRSSYAGCVVSLYWYLCVNTHTHTDKFAFVFYMHFFPCDDVQFEFDTNTLIQIFHISKYYHSLDFVSCLILFSMNFSLPS